MNRTPVIRQIPSNIPSLPLLEVDVLIVGGGPAGLMAADSLHEAGHAVHLFDAMPTVGRKFLLAGIGGLNLTHAEPFDTFVTRYGDRSLACRGWLERFGPQSVRDWAQGLGIETFVGSSQRVFPTDMKAAPLLRAWLHSLRQTSTGPAVTFHMRQRWLGDCRAVLDHWLLTFASSDGLQPVRARAVIFALGGGSWSRLGSDGAWTSWFESMGCHVLPLKPANCGFDIELDGRKGWSEFLALRHAGKPLKNVSLSFTDSLGNEFRRKGEFVLTATGVEGSLIYAVSALLREEILRRGAATFELDLRPELSLDKLHAELLRPRAGKTLSNFLKARVGLCPTAIALLHELLGRDELSDAGRLAERIKCLPVTASAARPIDEAISTAGGLALESLTSGLMLREQPGLFCAGEMLDWEAPTGGYLLTACLASGKVAGESASEYLKQL